MFWAEDLPHLGVARTIVTAVKKMSHEMSTRRRSTKRGGTYRTMTFERDMLACMLVRTKGKDEEGWR